MMLRILVVCSQFPPLNTTAARRPYFLARHLRDAGHQVTVITTLGTEQQPWRADLTGMRVHALPIAPVPDWFSFWQRWIARWAESTRGSCWQRTTGLLADLTLPLDRRHRWSVDEAGLTALAGPQDVVVATGPLWSVVLTGNRLAGRLKATFIADHRDPWNVAIPEVGLHVLTYQGHGPVAWLRRSLNRMRERQAMAGAALTTATKMQLRNAMAVNGDLPALQVYNGFDGPVGRTFATPSNERFTLLYTGSAYREQEWELVLQAVDLLEKDHPEVASTSRLQILGMRTAHDHMLAELGRRMDAHPTIERRERSGRDEVLACQRQADLLLHVGFGKKQVVPLKLFEYIASGRPVVQVSTGRSEQEHLLERTGTGTIVTGPEAFVEYWLACHAYWRNGQSIPYAPDLDAISTYSWDTQMERFHRFIIERHSARNGTVAPMDPNPTGAGLRK